MSRFARKALVFVCVFSMGCQHGNMEPEPDTGPVPDWGITETTTCEDIDEETGICLDDEEEPQEPTEVVDTDPPVEEPPEQEPLPEPQVVTELPAPEPEIAEPIPAPIPGSFKRLARACDVLSEASESGAVLNSLPAGRKLWTEDVDASFVRVFRSSGPAYLKVECFTELPEVVAVIEEPPVAPAAEPAPPAETKVAPQPEIRHEPDIQSEPVLPAIVEKVEPPPPPPPPPAPPSEPPMYERIDIATVQDDGLTPFALGGVAGLTIFGLFYLLTSRRQRRIDFNRTMTMTAF